MSRAYLACPMNRRVGSVFISHAGSDRTEAVRVGDLLRASNLVVRLDSSEVDSGISFVAFMESALSASDYCLLLWSRAANESRWVAVEWEAALHRAVTDASGFLIVCRLENHEVPALLRPRLFVDFYPQLQTGVEQVIRLLRADVTAGERTMRLVVKPRVALVDEADGLRVYVTSRLFGKTFPLGVRLDAPVVAVVDMIVDRLGLPRETTGEYGVRIRFDYGLAVDDQTLSATETLRAYGIGENDILWLETSVEPFASIEGVRRADGGVTYRSAPARNPHGRLWRYAQDALQPRIQALGLE